MVKTETVLKKVVLLGDSAVGKTSLIHRFVLDQFDSDYVSTIGTKVLKKVMPINYLGVPYEVNLMVWDIIGSQGFESSQSRHIAGLNGAILVMDLTNTETLDSLEEYWIPLLSEVSGNVLPPLLFIGNKIDLIEDKNSISDIEKELLNFGSKYQLKDMEKVSEDHKTWLLTSAKTGENVESGFMNLATEMLKVHPYFDPLSRQMDEVIADGIYSRARRDSPRSLFDMIIYDLPFIVMSSESSATILQNCITRLEISKDSPSIEDVRKIVDCVLRLASGKGGNAPAIEIHRKKWLDLLDKLE